MKFLLQLIVLITFLVKVINIEINIPKQTNPAYRVAFEYIKSRNKDIPIVVIDTTVNLYLSSFATELSKEWHLKPINVYQMLDSIDNIKIEHGVKINGLKNIKNKVDAEFCVLYFSGLIDTVLVAEILPRKKISRLKKYKDELDGNTLSHRDQAYFNTSIQYLFIFDRYWHLERVLTHKMSYN